MVVVDRRRLALTVHSKAIGRVVAVRASARHVVGSLLPSLHRESIVGAALVVLLWRTEGSEREGMVCAEAFVDREEIVVHLKLCALHISVAPALASHDCHAPASLGEACGQSERHIVAAVVAHAVYEAASFLRVYSASDDIDSSAYRWR